MVDWANPELTSDYEDFLEWVKARDLSAATLFEGSSDTNIPTNAKRIAASRLEKWDGAAWVDQLLAPRFPHNIAITAQTAAGVDTEIARMETNDVFYARTQWYFPDGLKLNSSIDYSAALTIKATSSDGSDTLSTNIAGGGSASHTRGGYVRASGNESGNPGLVMLVCGDVAGGEVHLESVGAQNIEFHYNNVKAAAIAAQGAFEHIGEISNGGRRVTLSDSGTVASTSNTTLLTYAVPDDTAGMVRVLACGVHDHASTDKGNGQIFTFAFRRINGGGVTIDASAVGSDVCNWGSSQLLFNAVASGNNVLIRGALTVGTDSHLCVVTIDIIEVDHQ